MLLYCIILNSFYLFAPFLATLAWEDIAPPVILFLSYLHSLKNYSNFRENLLSHLFIISDFSAARGISRACMEGGFTTESRCREKRDKAVGPLIALLSPPLRLCALSQMRGAVGGTHLYHHQTQPSRGSPGCTAQFPKPKVLGAAQGSTSEFPAAVSHSFEETLHQHVTTEEQLSMLKSRSAPLTTVTLVCD